MATAAVNERRNKQIQDAIDGQNWKQALALCEKRIKKGEDTLFLKAWKALILCHYPDEAHHKRGVTDTLTLCKLDPPVAEVEVLNLLQTSLDNIGDQKQLSQSLWEKAAKRKPQDEKLQRRWYSFATGRNDWKSAQKAAMSLQNNFPKDRKYYFWAIFMSYLISQDEQSTEMERKLFGTLSYRMISKAASIVPADPKELLSPARAIQNAEELYLLLEIYGSQNYDREALAILDSSSLGPKSRIAQSESTVLLSKIKFLHKAEQWDVALPFCRDLLGPPAGVRGLNGAEPDKTLGTTDDWDVWKLLLTSAQKIGTDEAINSVKDFLRSHINCEKPTRNARLAYLKLTDTGGKTDQESQEALFRACKSFWLDYQNKVYCFSDLRPYMFHLDEKHRKDFLDGDRDAGGDTQLHPDKLKALNLHDSDGNNISNGEQHTAEPNQKESSKEQSESRATIAKAGSFGVSKINELKFEYCFSLPLESPDAKASMEAFVSKCLSVYEQFLRTTQQDAAAEAKPELINVADDACLLAVMALVRLHEFQALSTGKLSPEDDETLSDPYLLQAAYLLEILLSKSPFNYQGQLLLTRIQLLLGVGSLAMKTFSRLKVKYLQTDTTLHHLLTRISTIHPHGAPYEQGSRTDVKDRDPLEALKEALYVYRLSKANSLYGKNAGLDNGSYVNVKDSIKLGHDLQFSICRLMFALESRRIQRLYSSTGDDFFDVISESASVPTVDHRDFQGFLDCELPSSPSFEEHVRIGPKPQQRWISAMIMTDRLFNILHSCHSKSATTPFNPEPPIPNLEKEPLDATDMTEAEISTWTMHINLTKLIYFILSDEPQTSETETLDSSIAAVEEWLARVATEYTTQSKQNSNIPLHATAFSTNLPIPDWSFLHWSFSILDTLKAVTLLLNFASQPSKSKSAKSRSTIPAAKINELQSLTTQIFDAIKDSARRLKDALSSGILEEFLDLILERQGWEDGKDQGIVGKLLETVSESVGGETFLETFCGGMRNAWDEALDGVLMVKL